MKQIGSVLLTLFLAGCAAPAVIVNVPSDHPASVEGQEATYSPTPTPLSKDSENERELADGKKGEDGKEVGSASRRHHQSCGGMK